MGANDPSGLIGEGALAIAQVNQLQSRINSKADAAETTAALAGKEPTIAENGLSQSRAQNLTSALLGKVSTQQLTDAIATESQP